MKSYLSNGTITLRAIEPEDIELLFSWENDPEIWEVSHTLVPYSKYILALYIKNADKDIYESKQLRLMIDTSEGKTIGAIDLFDLPDAVASIANYLKSHGFEKNRPTGNREAVYAYNHCDNYVKAIFTYAKALK